MPSATTCRSDDTVSTVGAGDNFNAGFIYGLIHNGVTREQLQQGLAPELWDSIIGCALDFSADCCRDIYNYVSVDFGNKYRQAADK